MSTQQSNTPKSSAPETQEKPKLKICCACPETKKLRDECMVQFGEEGCKTQIEAHKVCLRQAGFDV